jgi:hypothetical protein
MEFNPAATISSVNKYEWHHDAQQLYQDNEVLQYSELYATKNTEDRSGSILQRQMMKCLL